MGRIARQEVFSPDELAVVHVMNRTVRRYFLLGEDPLTGRNYEHRKVWIEEELSNLAAHFGIDLLCFAVMSNHFHLILRSRPDVVMTWSDAEVARRWLRLCPKRRRANGEPEDPSPSELSGIMTDAGQLVELRGRLSDLSWWIRLLSQRTGRRANDEDGQVGKFWQSRYRAVRLVDETSILGCSAYVDLNPIRASVVETLEESRFTSVYHRIGALQLGASASGHGASSSMLASLCPLELDEAAGEVGPQVAAADSGRASDKGFLPMSSIRYVELLDWTARQWRSDKRGATPAAAAPLFARLGIDVHAWCQLAKDFSRLFGAVAGQPAAIDELRSPQRGQRYNVPRRTRKLLE